MYEERFGPVTDIRTGDTVYGRVVVSVHHGAGTTTIHRPGSDIQTDSDSWLIYSRFVREENHDDPVTVWSDG